jgi:PilZ domain
MLLGTETVAQKRADRRQLPRMEFNCPMTYHAVGSSRRIPAHAVCLSGSGMLFEAEEALRPGTRLEIFAKPELPITPPLWAVVVVKRSRPVHGEPSTFHIAAEIEQML